MRAESTTADSRLIRTTVVAETDEGLLLDRVGGLQVLGVDLLNVFLVTAFDVLG